MIKGFVDQIIHWIWRHVAQNIEEVETSSNTLEIRHAEDGVFLSLRTPTGVTGGSTDMGVSTIVVSTGYIVVFFKETIKLL